MLLMLNQKKEYGNIPYLSLSLVTVSKPIHILSSSVHSCSCLIRFIFVNSTYSKVEAPPSAFRLCVKALTPVKTDTTESSYSPF